MIVRDDRMPADNPEPGSATACRSLQRASVRGACRPHSRPALHAVIRRTRSPSVARTALDRLGKHSASSNQCPWYATSARMEIAQCEIIHAARSRCRFATMLALRTSSCVPVLFTEIAEHFFRGIPLREFRGVGQQCLQGLDREVRVPAHRLRLGKTEDEVRAAV